MAIQLSSFISKKLIAGLMKMFCGMGQGVRMYSDHRLIDQKHWNHPFLARYNLFLDRPERLNYQIPTGSRLRRIPLASKFLPYPSPMKVTYIQMLDSLTADTTYPVDTWFAAYGSTCCCFVRGQLVDSRTLRYSRLSNSPFDAYITRQPVANP